VSRRGATAARDRARKALLHVVQVRLLREGRYESRLPGALLALATPELDEVARETATPAAWLRVRDLVVAELDAVERPLTGPGEAAGANLRYAALAALRGRDRLTAAASWRRIDERLGDAAGRLLAAVAPDGSLDSGAVAAARALLPRPLRRLTPATWHALRDALVTEWPDAHPLSAL
jgi:hypothetical protein